MSNKLPESIYKTSELMNLLGKRGIQKALDNEEIFNFERGYFITPDMPYDFQGYLYASSKFHPEAVVSKNTALFYYGLSEHLPEKIDLDVPRESKYRSGNVLFDFYRTKEEKIFEIVEVKILDRKVKIYSLERALFECLYYDPQSRGSRSSFAIRHFAKRDKINHDKLAQIAQKFQSSGQSGVFELINILNVLIDDKSFY